MKNKHQEKFFHHFQMLNDFMKYFPSHEWLWDQDNDMQSNVKVKCTFIIRSTNKKGILILFLVYYTSFHAEYKKLLALFLQIFQSMRLCREKILFFSGFCWLRTHVMMKNFKHWAAEVWLSLIKNLRKMHAACKT